MNFSEITPSELSINPFTKIGNDWMLITAGNEKGYNTMTASWGGLGFLWGKNVAFIFVRPSRYTFDFTEQNDYFSLSFFGEEYKKALSFCGANSGRDVDKTKVCNLTAKFTDNTVAFSEANLVIVCKKLYFTDLSADGVIDVDILKNYKDNDFHRMYVGEIVKIYKK